MSLWDSCRQGQHRQTLGVTFGWPLSFRRTTARNTCCNPNSTLTYTINEAGVINNLSTKIGKE